MSDFGVWYYTETTPGMKPIHVVAMLRWTARIVGVLLVLLILAFAIGEDAPNPLKQPIRVNLLSVALLTMLAGEMVAWKREEVGGVLILAGFACFAGINHGIRMNLVFAPMLVTGILFLSCHYAERLVKR